MDYDIGTKYLTSGKHPRVCTVTDIHITFNHAGLIVNKRYVATHEFCGQQMQEVDICATTIARGIDRLNQSNRP